MKCPSHLIYIRSVLFGKYKNRDSYRFHNLPNLTDITERPLSEKYLLLKNCSGNQWQCFLQENMMERFCFSYPSYFSDRYKNVPCHVLAHLSRRLKWSFLIKICPLSVIVVVVVVVVVVATFHIFIFFSRTTGPISTKLSANHPWMKGILVF